MDELQYLNVLRRILQEGDRKPTRTGTDTLSVFSTYMSFSLSDPDGTCRIPLLTTKKMNYRLIVEELLWFLSGSTDTKALHNKGVTIWDRNADRTALDRLGFTAREEGDLGPSYGFAWRHYGAPYVDCHTDYTNQGIDQLAKLLQNIKTDPFSRRHLVTAWNPTQLDEIALPPCHVMFQFNVAPAALLDLLVFQRSADYPLGVPFNIASYATLAHMVAQQTGLRARRLYYHAGDSHIYTNQIPGCHEQIERTPFTAPILDLTAAVDLFSYQWSDFTIKNYQYCPAIHFPFSV